MLIVLGTVIGAVSIVQLIGFEENLPDPKVILATLALFAPRKAKKRKSAPIK